MKSFFAIEQSTILRNVPPSEIVILAGAAVAGYKAAYGIQKDDSYFHVNDLDICVPSATYAQLAEAKWDANTYRGTTTYRRSFRLKSLEFPVEIDAGMEANDWSYDVIREHSVPYLRWRLNEPVHARTMVSRYGPKKGSDQTRSLAAQNYSHVWRSTSRFFVVGGSSDHPAIPLVK